MNEKNKTTKSASAKSARTMAALVGAATGQSAARHGATAARALGPSMADECLMSLHLAQGREPEQASACDRYQALATVIRRRQMDEQGDKRIRMANPTLARLISHSIGERCITDLDVLTERTPLAEDNAFRDQAGWARISILNVANVGRFASDRSIGEHAEGIWGIARLGAG